MGPASHQDQGIEVKAIGKPVRESTSLQLTDGLRQQPPHQTLRGKAQVVENDPLLLIRVQDPEYPGRTERVILFSGEAWDESPS